MVALSLAIAFVAAVAALAGLFWAGQAGPETLTTVHGEMVELYGRGLYRFDSIFKGAANRGSDVVTLALAIPLLLASTVLAYRGSLRAQFVQLGTLVWFLYVGVSLALSTAYNGLFLLHVALFSTSLFGVVLAFRSIDQALLVSRCSPRLPRRLPGVFMLTSGVVTLGIWLQPLVSAVRGHEPPALLEHYTTMVTDTLDLGVIVPLTILSGLLILQRAPLGYLLAFALLVLEALLAPMIAMQTVFQLDAGVTLTSGEAIGAISGFSVIALLAIGMIIVLLRHIADHPVTSRGTAAE